MKYDYEEFKSLDITQQEIDAIRKYIATFHTGMNSMLDLDPSVLTKLQSKAWVIDLSKENMELHIDSFEKMYSAMYKYNKRKGGVGQRLYRGTSRNEVNRLHKGSQYGRFLSTSTDENIAQTFAEYGNGAVILISADDNVPYINMDEFLGETQVSEKEILLAPYSQVGEITSYYNPPEGESRRYSLSVTKAEYKNLSEQERKKCEEQIYSFDINKELEKYKRCEDELEAINETISRLTPKDVKDDPDLLEYLQNKKSNLEEEFSQINNRFSTVRNSMNIYLQDRFKNIEIELDKQISEEEHIKDEENRINKIAEFRESKQKLIEKTQNVMGIVVDTENKYIEPDEKEVEITELAISTKSIACKEKQVEQENLERFESIKNNIEALKQEIENIEIPDDLSMEDMDIKGELMSKINEKYSQLEMTSNLMLECQTGIQLENQQYVETLDRKIAEKIKCSITNKAVADLTKQKEELATKKDSILDRITGKSKIKKVQIENLNLKINAINEVGLNVPEEIEGLGGYLKKYSQVLGIENLPSDAQLLLKNSLKNKEMPELDEDDRAEFEMYFNPNMLIEIDKKRSKKEIINSLEVQNQRLKERIVNSPKNIEEKSDSIREQNNNVDNVNIEDILEAAIIYSRNDERSIEEKREELKKNKTVDLFNKY